MRVRGSDLVGGINPSTTEQLIFDIGLERTDNNMELSSWPQIPAINQKNYYTYIYPDRYLPHGSS